MRKAVRHKTNRVNLPNEIIGEVSFSGMSIERVLMPKESLAVGQNPISVFQYTT